MRLVRHLLPAVVATVGLAAPLAVAPTAHAAPSCAGLKATIVGNDEGQLDHGTPRRDVVVARGGNDTIRGLAGNDVICGGDGADTILGGEGNDRLYGETDLVRLDQFGRVVKKGDTISGGTGDDTIDLGYDSRPASEGTTVVLDGVTYVNAPATGGRRLPRRAHRPDRRRRQRHGHRVRRRHPARRVAVRRHRSRAPTPPT